MIRLLYKKPKNGSDVVTMNGNNLMDKMLQVLNHKLRFLVYISKEDFTVVVEFSINKQLKESLMKNSTDGSISNELKVK